MSTAFRIFADGAQENPAVTSMATGIGFAVFDAYTNSLTYSVTVAGLDFAGVTGGAQQTADPDDDVTGAHIHDGARGLNGGVSFAFLTQDADDLSVVTNADGSTTLSGVWENTDSASLSISSYAAALGAAVPGDDAALYFNFHTSGNPGGEIRGQLVGLSDDAANMVIGDAQSEYLPGLAGDDTISGGGGDDTMNGGEGMDTAVFDVSLADATISFDNPNYVEVTTAAGVVQLESIEMLQFTDQTVSVDSQRATQIPENAVQVFAGDYFTGRSIDLSREGGGQDFLVGGPASPSSDPGNEFHFTPIAGGRAYFEGNGFLNPATGEVNRVIVDSEGGNTTRFGIQSFSQTLETMQNATWNFYETNIFNGNDTQTGSYHDDTLVGYAGDDILIGGKGDKEGYDVSSTPYPDPTPSTLRNPGDQADEQFWVDDGNDILMGEAGNDTLDGSTGDDMLVGGADDDVLYGGSGSDTAVIDAASTEFTAQELTDSLELTSADGVDVIHDDVEFIKFNDTTLSYAEIIAILNNTAPTAVTLTGTTTSIDENTDTSSRIKIADIVITDDGAGTNVLALTGTDAALFEIDGSELYLRAGTSLDYETASQLDVTVTVDDPTVGSTPDASTPLSIAVNDVNEAPTGVTLTGVTTNIDENSDTTSRVKIADIAVTDDALGTNTLALTGTDQDLFEIDGTELFLKAGTVLNFEEDSQLDVTVTVDDTTVGATPDTSTSLALAVNDVNDAPTGGVSINGTPIQFTTLSAVSTLQDEDGVGPLSYQWLRSGTAIADATSMSYTLGSDDLGSVISVRVTFTDGGGTVEAASSATTSPVTAITVIEGTTNDDSLVGTPAPEAFRGFGGNDIIIGGGGPDRLEGGTDNDILIGEVRGIYHTDISAQVFRMYSAVFGREPDLGGHQSWATLLSVGSRTLDTMAAGFVASAEFQQTYGDTTNAQFVTLLYNNVLDRDPNPSEVNGWVANIEGNMPRAEVVRRFAESPEHVISTAADQQTFDETRDPTEWADDVYRLFRAIFDRDPDEGGFTGWVENLSSGRFTFDAVVSQFMASPEFQATYGDADNTQFVGLLYTNVLGRDADAGGLAGWISNLNGGMSREEVVQRFMASPEFVIGTEADLRAYIAGYGPDDLIDPGTGNAVVSGGLFADTFVFTDDAVASTVTVTDVEVWDTLQFNGFGLSAAQLLGRMTQDDDDVLFVDGTETILFANTDLADITQSMITIA